MKRKSERGPSRGPPVEARRLRKGRGKRMRATATYEATTINDFTLLSKMEKVRLQGPLTSQQRGFSPHSDCSPTTFNLAVLLIFLAPPPAFRQRKTVSWGNCRRISSMICKAPEVPRPLLNTSVTDFGPPKLGCRHCSEVRVISRTLLEAPRRREGVD
jgi:hypothetical protein